MVGGLGQLADAIGKGQRLGKVTEVKDPLQAGNALDLDDLPGGQRLEQLVLLGISERRGLAAAGEAAGLAEFEHGRAPGRLAIAD